MACAERQSHHADAAKADQQQVYDPLPRSIRRAPLMCSGVTLWRAEAPVDRPRQRNLLLIGLGGVGMMGLAFAQAMFKQKIAVADLSPAARESALKNGAGCRLRSLRSRPGQTHHQGNRGRIRRDRRFCRQRENRWPLAVAAVARGGKIVVSGTDGRQFQPAIGTMDLQAQ